MVHTLSALKKNQWPAYLAELTYMYNNSQHSSTKQTTFYLMFGRHGRLPIDLEMGTPASKLNPLSSDWVSFHWERLYHAHTLAEKGKNKASAAQRKHYNRGTKEQKVLHQDALTLSHTWCRVRHEKETFFKKS